MIKQESVTKDQEKKEEKGKEQNYFKSLMS